MERIIRASESSRGKSLERMWIDIANQLSWVMYGEPYASILGHTQYIINGKLKKLTIYLPEETFLGYTGKVKGMLHHLEKHEVEVHIEKDLSIPV